MYDRPVVLRHTWNSLSTRALGAVNLKTRRTSSRGYARAWKCAGRKIGQRFSKSRRALRTCHFSGAPSTSFVEKSSWSLWESFDTFDDVFFFLLLWIHDVQTNRVLQWYNFLLIGNNLIDCNHLLTLKLYKILPKLLLYPERSSATLFLFIFSI